jgi:hypothetical protein
VGEQSSGPATDTGGAPGVYPTLADAQLQARFARHGWVTTPLLDAARVASLRSAVEPFIPADRPPLYSPHRGDEPVARRRIHKLLVERLGPVVDELLAPSHRIFMAGLVVKRPGPEGALALHQDWTYVDERRFVSGVLWIPLVDTEPANGGLYAIDGSHDLALTYRGSPDWPQACDPIREELESSHVTPLKVEAGSVAVLDNRLLHGSFPNLGTEDRIVVALGFAPSHAEVIHYHRDARGTCRRLRVDPSFLLAQELSVEPGGAAVLGSESVDLPDVRFGAAELDMLQARREPA